MITDEQIRDLWSWSATREAEQTATTQQHAFARKLIALAQQVKPLEIVQSPSGVKHAHTPFGTYSFCAYIDEVRMALPEEMNYYGRGYLTEAEAIEAANADYQRRVLSCLVNGGV